MKMCSSLAELRVWSDSIICTRLWWVRRNNLMSHEYIMRRWQLLLAKSVFQFRLASREYNVKLNETPRFTVPTWNDIKSGCWWLNNIVCVCIICSINNIMYNSFVFQATRFGKRLTLKSLTPTQHYQKLLKLGTLPLNLYLISYSSKAVFKRKVIRLPVVHP